MENIQKKYEELFKHSCYVFCLCYKFSGTKYEWIWLEKIARGVQAEYITKECYVAKPVEFISYTLGVKIKDVVKVDFKKSELTEDVNIVMYEYNGGTHFVCMNKEGDVIFDPSGDSNSVKYGIPVSIRKYIK
jgi:hypothetical protein